MRIVVILIKRKLKKEFLIKRDGGDGPVMSQQPAKRWSGANSIKSNN
jgi:hypothetical protein